MNAIAEHTEAILTRDVEEQDLKQGDVGTVVSVRYAEHGATPAGYTLEIFSISGQSRGVRNVEAGALREAGPSDITHARPASA